MHPANGFQRGDWTSWIEYLVSVSDDDTRNWQYTRITTRFLGDSSNKVAVANCFDSQAMPDARRWASATAGECDSV